MFSDVPQLTRTWWLFVVLGLISVGAGVVMIVWPGKTLLVLGVIAGVYLMFVAIMEIVDAIAGPPGGRAVSAILGVITLIAGLICIRRPGASLLAIVLAVGIYLIAAGVIRIVRAFAAAENRGWTVALGALDALVGIVILAWPGIGLVTLAVFFAVTMLVHGIFAIVIGFKLRGLRHEEPPPVRTATLAT
jgi:uncharacterized membrane protein HdeD (DUF308 family)